jgi:ankyrin repeat protein
MKSHLLLTTIAGVVLVGCGPSVNIYKAAATKNIEVVKQYLAAGNDVNKKNVVSQTPLHYASASGDKEIIELLIGKDADLNATDKFGKTPLDLANMNGRTETADLLRKHGGKMGEKLKAEGK